VGDVGVGFGEAGSDVVVVVVVVSQDEIRGVERRGEG
jgi:hypothetical protein